MRHYLTVATGNIPREREVYEAFKDYSRTTPVQGAGIEALVKEWKAPVYNTIHHILRNPI
jgi:hypothetical protein